MSDPVDDDRRSLAKRRTVLATLGAATVPLAGCSILGGDSSTPTETAEPVSTPSGPSTEVEPLSEGFSDRVNGLLDEMSVTEQAGQTALFAARTNSPESIVSTIEEYGVGGVLYGGARPPTPSDPQATAETFNRFQRAAMESGSTDVPLVVGIDAVHGNATVQPAAAFPHNIGLGATWDTDLVERIGAVTARSMRSLGVQWNFSPVADVAHDPRWGRYYESPSQDPHVTGQMVAASVRGQQRPTDVGRAAATVKHFGGYSFTAGGDDRANADISRRRLRESVLPPYRAGVDADTETVMANSAAVNGVPGHASEWLLTTVLRERWGFNGLTTGDWEDLWRMYEGHEYVESYRDAIRVAFNAGLDVAMAPREIDRYVSQLVDLVESEEVPGERLRTAAGRMLQLKERLGLLDSPLVDPSAASEHVVRPGDRELAREAARKSMTVLQSDALPLSDVDSVFVTGPNGSSASGQLGGWTIGWQGVTDVIPQMTTVVAGMESVAPDGTSVEHVPTGRTSFEDRDAVRSAAADADATVVVLGEGAYAEGEGHVDDLALPAAQREVVEAVVDEDTTTIGVLLAGRPRGSPELFDSLDALVMGYYPGSEGGTAVAETLFDENPHRGALPFTWPTSIGQGHAGDHGRRGIDGVDDPLFAFGAGGDDAVSMTLDTVNPGELSAGDEPTATATIDVTNDAERRLTVPVIVRGTGTIRASDQQDPTVVPGMDVVGFDRVDLEGDGETSVSIPLSLDALGTVDGDVLGNGERVLPAGRYRIAAGESTTSIGVAETISLE